MANKKTVAIQGGGKDLTVELAMSKTKKQNQPGKLKRKSVMNKEFYRMDKVVANQIPVVFDGGGPSVVYRSLKVSKSGVKKRSRQNVDPRKKMREIIYVALYVVRINAGTRLQRRNLQVKEGILVSGKHVTNDRPWQPNDRLLVCLKSDAFVTTHGGNFSKLIIRACKKVHGSPAEVHKARQGAHVQVLWEPFHGLGAMVKWVVCLGGARVGAIKQSLNYHIQDS
ncbi:hypothetical protein IFM89_004950 [Coptis chinensis]|uniref:Uncharacterized protein n=1 Tax=Coptis chinensis TaxID=261450 RepID=A0A835HRS2_9MAGN|nr:hypothetical protein IFM89_004950 [Coptis chinensis]